MNRHYYEFWGRFFTQLARFQKQLEEMNALMQQGFTVAGKLNKELLDRLGLSPPEADEPEAFQTWQQTMIGFQQALAPLAELWGWVPRSEHEKILNRCAALEKQVQQQQATINALRTLLDEKGLGHGELFVHLKNALKEQSDQFHALMESIHEAGKKKS